MYISAVAKEDTKGWTSQGLRMKDMEPKTWFKSQPGIYQLVVLDQVPTYLPTYHSDTHLLLWHLPPWVVMKNK